MQSEQKFIDQETKEKQHSIQGLKEQLLKIKTQKQVTLKYLQKELETSQQTIHWLYKQKEDDILTEKKHYEILMEQEGVVIQKTKVYLA